MPARIATLPASEIIRAAARQSSSGGRMAAPGRRDRARAARCSGQVPARRDPHQAIGDMLAPGEIGAVLRACRPAAGSPFPCRRKIY